MGQRHVPAQTTHTVELEQIQQLNDRLLSPHDHGAVTASALGVAGEPVLAPPAEWAWDLRQSGEQHVTRLPAEAVLEHVSAEGPPSFPYIWGRFRAGGSPAGASLLLAPLHTEALLQLGHNLGLRHRWGC